MLPEKPADSGFADTADVYSGGQSEEMLGRFPAEPANRDRMAIATKSGFPRTEGSLRQLGTDFVDRYWTHAEFRNGYETVGRLA